MTRTQLSLRATWTGRLPISPTMRCSIFNGEGPISGDHKGREAIEKALIDTFELTGGTQALDIHSVFADDRHAVVALHETATRNDGATLDIEEAHVLTIDPDGKITNLWDLPADPEAHDRFFDGR